MADWKSRATELFPEIVATMDDDETVYSLFFELLPSCIAAHAGNDREQLEKIYGYAEWCLRQDDTNLWNAAAVAFYEHLVDEQDTLAGIPEWLSPDVFYNLAGLLQWRMEPDAFAKLVRDYTAIHGRRPIDERSLEFKVATYADADTASSILIEAAEWLRESGMPMWRPEELTIAKLLPVIAARELIIASLDYEPIGMMIVQWTDEHYWPDITDGNSAFLHRLAVRRSVAGHGIAAKMIAHAEDIAREAGKTYLRLDCARSRTSLCQFYESLGFVLNPANIHPNTHIARYEKNITWEHDPGI